MSDAKKPMVVWAHPDDVEKLREAKRRFEYVTPRIASDGFASGDKKYLLLPIEDGALRVGQYLFRWGGNAEPEWRHVEDAEWTKGGSGAPEMLWDLLMDAVEGVEP